jgi:transcriptional/translational regulatory protein YebC/TACO1
MAGHSKWAQIKRSKAVVDAKRGALFTRLGREITVAARGGSDPAANFQLRTAIEKAKAAAMPSGNIERAIAKGSGQGSGAGDQFEAVRYEGYGPGGIAILIEAFTDNRNRSAAELRLAFNKNGGNLGESGCVGYLFEHLGVVRLGPANTLGSAEPGAKATGNDGSRSKASAPGTSPTGWLDEDALLEDLLALEDLGGPAVLTYDLDGDQGQRSGAELVTAYADLEALQDQLRSRGWPVASWEHRWIAQTGCQVSDSQVLGSCLKLLDALEELDDVRSVTTNLEAEETLMQGVLA